MLFDLLIPLGVGSLVALVAIAFALYAWTWYRHVASCVVHVRFAADSAPCSPAVAV